MLRVEDWAEIRRLHRAEGMPIKAVARLLGLSKNTVKAALASNGPPKYVRTPRGSIVDEVEPRLHELLKAWPDMPATVIAERIGWTRSMTVLKERIRELRPVYLPPDPASRTTYQPGELAQCDLWFPDADIPLGAGQNGRGQVPVLTMVSGYSRWISARLIPSRQTEDLFAGQWALIEELGAVPRALVWDGESAVGRWRGRRMELTEATQAFRGVLGVKVVLCKPGDPEAKGLVERAHRYFETSFLPGRTFTDPADFNAQFAAWLAKANTRVHRRLDCRPSERIEHDRQVMLSLPPVAPTTGWHLSQRLPRDHYVRVASNDYSVHPAAVGRRVEVQANLERAVVTCEGRIVAEHVRCWARHQTLTDPVHARAAEALRRDRGMLRLDRAEVDVERRALTDYDRALGVDLASPSPSGALDNGPEDPSEPGLSEDVA
ncbi:MAG: IS21 family transposase [Actinobacteria bacterium]|nr:IS21 family transposase [Actinomycetota bacterium]